MQRKLVSKAGRKIQVMPGWRPAAKNIYHRIIRQIFRMVSEVGAGAEQDAHLGLYFDFGTNACIDYVRGGSLQVEKLMNGVISVKRGRTDNSAINSLENSF